MAWRLRRCNQPRERMNPTALSLATRSDDHSARPSRVSICAARQRPRCGDQGCDLPAADRGHHRHGSNGRVLSNVAQRRAHPVGCWPGRGAMRRIASWPIAESLEAPVGDPNHRAPCNGLRLRRVSVRLSHIRRQDHRCARSQSRRLRLHLRLGRGCDLFAVTVAGATTVPEFPSHALLSAAVGTGMVVLRRRRA